MRTFTTAVAALLVVTSTAFAQSNPQTRSGFTISFGVGAGSASFDCDNCTSDSETGGSGYLRIGAAVRPNLIVAGQATGWTKEEGGATLTASNLTATLQWYPNTNGGFYVLGGAGFGSIDAQIEIGGGTFSRRRSGLGLQAGAGYDWRVGRNFSLTPFGGFFLARVGEDNDASEPRITAKVFQFGLGFTWH